MYTIEPNASSKLASLWIDDDNEFSRRIDSVPSHLAEYVSDFSRDGYVVIKNAVSEEVIDQILQETDAIFSDPEKYVVRNAGKYVDPVDLPSLGIGDRIIDLYGVSPAARQAIHSPIVTEFLQLVFEEPAIAMQSLSFNYGSQQSIHQDTAYVISKEPLKLAASWLALEDVTPGAGELIYYPGSHKFDHFLFGGDTKGWEKKRHGDEAHMEFLKQLHDQAKARGIEIERFIAKKGDILIWHADLAHGGARSTIPGQTRKSLVTHYCPFSNKPKFVDLAGEHYFEHRVDHTNGATGYFASRHYELEDLSRTQNASIYYDGGVSRRRGMS